MNPNQRNALAGALQSGPPAPPMAPGGPPPGAGGAPGGPPGGEAPMSPDQAMQLLSSLGITPDNMPMVMEAISTVMEGGGSGGPPPGAGGPPPGAPPGMPPQ